VARDFGVITTSLRSKVDHAGTLPSSTLSLRMLLWGIVPNSTHASPASPPHARCRAAAAMPR
jgi:hypothetical protein